VARTLIKLAILELDLLRPSRALSLLAAAGEHLDASEDVLLVGCTVTARVNALTEVGCIESAEAELAAHAELFRGLGDLHAASIYEGMLARLDVAHGRFARADARFAAGFEQYVELGRTLDACMIGLYRAAALRRAGKTGQARRLARQLVPMFAARGVEREMFATLRLLFG
jgi:hypothetical protein